MRLIYFLLFTFYFLLALACQPAAAPISVGNKPVSINNIPQTNVPLPPSKPLGEMSWTIFDGAKEQKLKDLQGKVVVLDFWATYCPPCLEEIPHLNYLQTNRPLHKRILLSESLLFWYNIPQVFDKHFALF